MARVLGLPGAVCEQAAVAVEKHGRDVGLVAEIVAVPHDGYAGGTNDATPVLGGAEVLANLLKLVRAVVAFPAGKPNLQCR